jgi:peptide/nickel transport system substrate-binding protein
MPAFGRHGPLASTWLKRALLLVAVLAACQATPASPAPAASAPSGYAPEPPATRGGTLVLADWEPPNTLDPIHATTVNDLRVAGLLFAPLWTLSPDLKSQPDLLREVPTIANGDVRARADGVSMTVDLKLRSGLRWSDGSPLTADDLIFTVDAICSAALPARDTSGFDHIASQERKSDTEVVWHFGPRPRGACGLPADLASGLFPAIEVLGPRARLLPARRLASIPEAAWPGDPFFQRPDVVSGPFAVKDEVAGRLIDLAANPAYAAGRAHAAWLDGITYRFYNGKASMIAGLQAGEADVGFHLLPGDATELRGIARSRTVVTTSLQGEFLSPNHGANTATGRPPPWSGDPRILAALAAAIDRKALDNAAFDGAATIAHGLFPPQLAGYSQPAVGPTIAEARATLATSRPAFTLLTVCDSEPRQVEQAELVRQWNAAGASVSASCAPRDRFFAGDGPNATGAFDISLYSNSWEPDPAAWAAFAVSSATPGPVNPGGRNWSRCQDRALDQDFFAGASTLDPARRRTAYLDAAAEWQRYGCTIPLFEWPAVLQVTSRLHNFAPDPTLSMDTWNAADWWLSAP